MTNHAIKPLIIASAAALLSACASTGVKRPSQTDAQTALADAVKGQMRTAFSYQTEINISSHLREEALAAATPEQLTAVDDKMQLCEEQHDAAYIAWLKTLQAEGVDIKALDAVKYTDQLTQFKDSYTACADNRTQQLIQAKVLTNDLGSTSQDDQALIESLPDDQMYSQTTPSDAGLGELANSSDTPLFMDRHSHTMQDNISYLPDYDSDHTKLDQKKVALINAYLIKPTKITVTGRYQPLAGQITALPAFDYQANNLQAHINQPIHLDLKAGVLYLWADNFAAVNSETLDKTLGDKWRNKWLAVPINDGSLPDDFSKTLIKSFIKAKQQSFLSLDKTGFDYVTADSVLGLPKITENLSDNAKRAIQATRSIIRDASSVDEQDFARYVFADTLYDELAAAYPELLPQMVMGDDKVIIDGESEIHVVNLANDKPVIDEATAVQINSRFLVQLMMGMLSVTSGDYQAGISYRASQFDADLSEANTPAVYQTVSHYGVSANRVNWIHKREYADNLLPLGLGHPQISAQQPLLIDKFTMVLPITHDSFNTLPADSRTPTAANTINLPDYAQDLITRLQSDDDKYLQLLLALLGGSVVATHDDTQFDEAPMDMPAPSSE